MATVNFQDGNIGTGASSTISANLVSSAQVGDMLVALVAWSAPSGAFTSVTDVSGNTWTTRAEIDGSGAHLAIATCEVTILIASGASKVTAHFSPSATKQAIQVWAISPSGGETLAFVAADATGQASNATSHFATTVSVADSQVIIGAAGIETNDTVGSDSDVTRGSWSLQQFALADAGTDVGSVKLVSQSKIATGTGNQSWAVTTVAARQSARSNVVIGGTLAAFSLPAAQGSYALSGTAATMRLGLPAMVAGVGSYALTGTAASPLHGWLLTAAAGSYALTGTAASPFYGRDLAATAGSYVLTGTTVTLTASVNKVTMADPGTYVLTGTDANLLHAWLLAAAAGSYALSGTAASPLLGLKIDATVAGSYLLTGTDVALNAATGNKTLLADLGTYLLTGTNATLSAGFMVAAAAGSYALTGTAATLTASVPAAPPIRAMGEPPIARERRRRIEAERARALEQQRKARDRLKRAIGRLLEGLPPEFDEPEQLAQAEGDAIKAFNLLQAMRAPAPELDAIGELITTINELRLAKPIVQLELARAYNHSHRHLMQKAQEDVVMTLLLGE